MRIRLFCITILFCVVLCCIVLPAFADDSDYWLDLPDEMTVGLNEQVTAFFHVPGQYISSNSIYIVCENGGGVMDGWATTRETTDTYADFDISFRFNKKGDYVFHVQHGSWIKRMTVHVDDLATFVPDRQVYALTIGETITVSFTKTGGALYSACKLGSYDYTGGITVKPNDMMIVGNKIGSYAVSLNGGGNVLCTFEVIVVDPSENIHLEPQYSSACVGLNVALPVLDSSGRTVCALVEITEGAEYASLYYNTNATTICYLNPSAPGWVTITAYGTDGSTDSVRMRIYKKPTSSNVSIPSTTIAAGESMVISIDYPEDSWYPVSMWLSSPTPASNGLTGPVAILQDGVLTGLMPGTCELTVQGVSAVENYVINITDSDQALTIVRPESGFYWQESFQMSVQDKTGRVYPAAFSLTSSHIFTTEDGLLTADGISQGTVYIQLENGLSYNFTVKTVDVPSWLRYNGEPILISLNETYTMYSLDSDIGSLDYNHLIMCSNDERIVQCSGQTICPVSIGSGSVTIWSRYNDVCCEVPVTVIGPSDVLYIDGKEVGDLSVPIDSDPIKLPTVTDYYGNTVKVTWEKIQDSPGVGNPKTYSVTLNKTKGTVTANWRDGAGAVLQATSNSGASIRLYIFPYIRSTAASFGNSEYNIHVGGRADISFSADPSTNHATLESQDVTFTVTGDTDSVYVQDAFLSYHTLVGLKPGTVTLTAKLWNGKIYTTTVTVTAYEPCAEGHAPNWQIISPASLTRNGIIEQHCTRCGLVLSTEVIPCTGVLGFSQEDFFVPVGDSISLGTNLSGSQKYSFTWDSSDPTVVSISADRATGLKAGTATITVSTGDCAPATCRVHVVQSGAINVLRLPKNLKTIEAGAFEGVFVSYVVVPSGAETIGSRAFADCTQLVRVVLPASVRSIDENAFAGSSLVTFECPSGSYAESYANAHGIPVIH